MQLHHTGGAGAGNTVDIWLRKNGTNIADTNTQVTVQSNNPYVVAAWDFLLTLNSGDYLELMWSTDNTSIQLEALPSNLIHPAVPSAIVTVIQVMYTQVGPQGYQGIQGVQGVQGFQGTQGTQGNQGNQGNSGFQGNQGRQGTQGNQGNQGMQGTQGVQGTQGNQGNQGLQGDQGYFGTQGNQGNQGTQGTQGVQGMQGTQGVQGIQGVQGRQGPGTALTIDSGTYSPTVEANDYYQEAIGDCDTYEVTHQDTVTACGFKYMRIGDIVHVSGQVDVDGGIDPSYTTNTTALTISLPITSYFTSKCDLNGVGSLDCYNGEIQSAIIYACTDQTLGGGTGTNDRAIVEYKPLQVVYRIDVVFTYRIISAPPPPPPE